MSYSNFLADVFNAPIRQTGCLGKTFYIRI